MPQPPPETCSECGKTISGEAQAHVWQGDRIVCFRCFTKLDEPRRRAEWRRQRDQGIASRRHLPPTDTQLDLAEELGLAVPRGAMRGELSDLISAELDRRGL